MGFFEKIARNNRYPKSIGETTLADAPWLKEGWGGKGAVRLPGVGREN